MDGKGFETCTQNFGHVVRRGLCDHGGRGGRGFLRGQNEQPYHWGFLFYSSEKGDRISFSYQELLTERQLQMMRTAQHTSFCNHFACPIVHLGTSLQP